MIVTHAAAAPSSYASISAMTKYVVSGSYVLMVKLRKLVVRRGTISKFSKTKSSSRLTNEIWCCNHIVCASTTTSGCTAHLLLSAVTKRDGDVTNVLLSCNAILHQTHESHDDVTGEAQLDPLRRLQLIVEVPLEGDVVCFVNAVKNFVAIHQIGRRGACDVIASSKVFLSICCK